MDTEIFYLSESHQLLLSQNYGLPIQDYSAIHDRNFFDEYVGVTDLNIIDESQASQSIHKIESDILNEFNVSKLQFFKNKLIGGGSYGRVYHGKYEDTPVAVKTLLICFEDENASEYQDFVQEAEILL